MRIEPVLSRLESVLEKVREQHPFRGQSHELDLKTLVDRVRKKLEDSPFNRLRSLAFEFKTKELVACLEILITAKDEKLVRKAGEVLKCRPKDRLILRGWFKLVQRYPHKDLEGLLRTLIRDRGFEILETNRKVSSCVSNWWISNELPEGILRDYQNGKTDGNLDGYLKENFLKEDDGLFKSSWRHFLKKGNAQCIKKESPRRILQEFRKADNGPYLQSFGQHYLNALKGRDNWDEKILEFLLNKYGVPKALDKGNDIETPFWKRVDTEVKREFHLWYMLRSLETFFEGTRASFWREYVESGKVVRVKEILDGYGFLLDFGLFGVVEFKHLGNAAYVYPGEIFVRYWANSERRKMPTEFKNREKTVRHASFPAWDGRIIHHRNWQGDASTKINRLLRKI